MDVQITIPQLYDGTTFYKLYVYCSKDMQAIDTITKVRTLVPSIVIDESTFDRSSSYFQSVNGKQCYVIPANLLNAQESKIPGVIYTDAKLNILPTSEYESVVDVVQINPYTYTSSLTLNNIYTGDNGIMLYYSVIGINEVTNQITHLSKVSGVRIKLTDVTGMQRELSCCDKYTGKDTDVWKVVRLLQWDEPIVIGDASKDEGYRKFGIPFVETIPVFHKDTITYSFKMLYTKGCFSILFPNVWKQANKNYNFRLYKAYRIINVFNGLRSEPSEPTYQYELPLGIEKIRLLLEKNPTERNIDIPYEAKADNITCKEIIRRKGIFYNKEKHDKLNFNELCIPADRNISVFSESSVQPKIEIEVYAAQGDVFNMSFYLVDTYGHISLPITTSISL